MPAETTVQLRGSASQCGGRGNPTVSTELQERALQAYPAADRAPRATLRTSMVLAAFTLVLAALASFILGLYVFVYLPLAHDLATSQLRIVSEQVEGRLRTLINRLEAIARLNHDWGREGLIDLGNPTRFNELYRPIIERGPQLSSVVVANESGRELLLRHEVDGSWTNRLTDPAMQGKRARFLRWSSDGRLLGEETRDFDYDARQRPWFMGGMALVDENDIHWSEPYVFRSSLEPGLSVVVSWRAGGGERYAMTTDIRLIDLSRFTRDIVAGKTGFVTVFTGDGRVIGVPHDMRFAQEDAIKAAVLRPAGDIGVAPLTMAVDLWRRAGGHEGDAIRFDLGSTTWLATFKPMRFGTQTFWVATMAPEADFSAATTTQAALIALLVLATLVPAWFAATGLARRFTRPLESLTDESQRIGRLELADPVVVHAPWRELDALARAQEGMRVELLGATSRLADANDRLEARVRERTQQLAEAKDKAEAASRAKADFLANMSHEIRTPMNAIIGMTDLALRTHAVDKQRGYLSKVKVAAGSLLAIINDILDFSKIEAGKLDMESREFRLDEVLEKLTAVVGLRAQEKGLELLLNTADDVPPVLIGDSLRLEQVLVNLCSNAIKFTASGEIVVVTVKTLVTANGRATLRFSVRDTGIGMTEQQAAGLFQPFNQLDASTTRQYGGTGLGLAICKRLVGLMGGEIGVKSQPGKGSDFHFTADFGVAAPSHVTRPVAPPNLCALRILVIDDSQNSREIMHGLLVSLGYQPALASSARAGLAELQHPSTGVPYDLVLLDWKMPDMDGFAVVEALRASQALPHLPRIVMVTAYGDDALMHRAAAERLDGCIAKPVSASALLDAIVSAFGAAAEDEGRRIVGPVAPHAAPASLNGRRVLLVEDNEFNQIVASELLGEIAGMRVTIARNGQEAVDYVRAEPFDAVLMDVQMPVMDGYQATALIRRHPRFASLPIIAMTANAMAGDREKSLAVGMNDHVTKPFEPTQLFAVLSSWMPLEKNDSGSPSVAGGATIVKAISFELGLQRCLGRTDLYLKLLERFMSTHSGDTAEIATALNAGELDKAACVVHNVVSTAGTIGAEGLSEAARGLQLAIEAGEAKRWPELIDVFAHHHAMVSMQLRAYLAERPATSR